MSNSQNIDASNSTFVGGHQYNYSHGEQHIHNVHTHHTFNVPIDQVRREFLHHLESSDRAGQEGIRDFINRTERRYEESEFLELVRRLDAVNYRDDLDKSLELKLDGTCEWAISHSKFQNLISPSQGSHGVWICGKPGSGKTIIAAALIDHILKRPPSSSPPSPTVTLFFFCDNKSEDPDHTSPIVILQTFLVQMLYACDADTERRNQLIQDINQALGTDKKLSFRQVAKAFKSAMKSFSFIHIIIDAIDECQNREPLITFLRDLLESAEVSTPVGILLISREESDIQELTESSHWDRIDVTGRGEQDENAADIDRYVTEKIAQLRSTMPQLRRSQELTDKIKDRLLQSADGMFLYIRVMFDRIQSLKNSSVVDIENTLASLPRGLKAMYVSYFRDLAQRAVEFHESQENRPFTDSLTVRALRFLIAAKRPLRLEEISAAIVLEFGDTEVKEDRMLADSKAVVYKLLGALVDIRQPRPDWVLGPPDKEDQTSGLVVTLVHASVKEFLTSDLRSSGFQDDDLAARFLTSVQTANTWTAKTCLSYLALDGVFTQYIIHFRDLNFYTPLPLLQYAGEYWTAHIVDSQSAGSKSPELRHTLHIFTVCALKRVLTSTLCISNAFPELAKNWNRRDSILADVGISLRNTIDAIRELIHQFPDLVITLSNTADSLPESFAPPPYATYDIRRTHPSYSKTLNKILQKEDFDLVALLLPLYDTRDHRKFRTRPREVQLALEEVAKKIPSVKDGIKKSFILLATSKELHSATVAMSSLEVKNLPELSGEEARNVVHAFSVAIRSLDILSALPCLPYVPVDTFDHERLFKVPIGDPFFPQYFLASMLQQPPPRSTRSENLFMKKIEMYKALSSRSYPPSDTFVRLATPVIFSTMFLLGWAPPFVFSSILIYRTSSGKTYSFEKMYTHNHPRLRASGPIRVTLMSYMIGRLFTRLWRDGFISTLTWLTVTFGLTISYRGFWSLDFKSSRRVLLFKALFHLSCIIGYYQALTILLGALVISVVFSSGHASALSIVLWSVLLQQQIFAHLSDISGFTIIEFFWSYDVLTTCWILITDPAGLQEILQNHCDVSRLIEFGQKQLELIKIMLGICYIKEMWQKVFGSTERQSPESVQLQQSNNEMYQRVIDKINEVLCL